MGFVNELTHGLKNVFSFDRETQGLYNGGLSYVPQSQTMLTITRDRDLLSAIYTRLAVDASSVDVFHGRVDENENYIEELKTDLNECLRINANIDQTGRAFMRDLFMTMFDTGASVAVPVEAVTNLDTVSIYDVKQLRVGVVNQFYPRHVVCDVYDENVGLRKEVALDKRYAAVVENPFYHIMNAPNSTLQRLIAKINRLDAEAANSGFGRLNAFIHLPYHVKTELRRNQARERMNDINEQLRSSPYGLAYIGAEESITPFNRAAENALLEEIKELKADLLSQLGLSQDILNGSADPQTLINYRNRTIVPFLKAATEAMTKTFLTKTARTQGERIMFRLNPFELLSPTELPEVADKFTRNEVMTSNEVRSMVGLRPSGDPKADELRNKNIAAPIDPLTEGNEDTRLLDYPMNP